MASTISWIPSCYAESAAVLFIKPPFSYWNVSVRLQKTESMIAISEVKQCFDLVKKLTIVQVDKKFLCPSRFGLSTNNHCLVLN